ncbi:uncharacterized protein LOC122313552 isoform X1 [Carya illinoinensis]|uniref:uncharacterized protein LOC122313552 isoform X1 n=1 Tax=Carya illinoinensis TaxID=32201 RepID=UPI001C723B3D|nr:uncharacterized protein LOC122313552 isoform X1 [Carya illinoinensis]
MKVIGSAMEPDKHHDYHLLDSESALPVGNDLKNGRRREGATESESHKSNLPKGTPVHRKAYLNKFALAGAILASTNSILLGHGITFQFPCADIGVMSGAVLFTREFG